MRCTFYRPENVNLDEYENIIGKMEYDLVTLIHAKTNDLEVYHYVMNLVHAAKPLDRNPEMCFWGMDDPDTMPSDARRDYFYRPTYLATAYLMQAMLKYPELENPNEVNWEFGDECVKELMAVLPKAMRACTSANLLGHGYDGLSGQLRNMELFLTAGAADFVKKYPDMCSKFTQMFNGILDSYRDRLEKGDTRGGWGEDYAQAMKDVIGLAELPF